MKNKKYIDNKSDRLVQLESPIQNGVRTQLISFNKDQTQITYYVKEPIPQVSAIPKSQSEPLVFAN